MAAKWFGSNRSTAVKSGGDNPPVEKRGYNPPPPGKAPRPTPPPAGPRPRPADGSQPNGRTRGDGS